MFSNQPGIEPGQVIKASWLNHANRVANKVESRPAGEPGYDFSSMRGGLPPAPPAQFMVRMTADAVPEAEDGDGEDFSEPGEPNAVRLFWDDEEGDWGDEIGGDVYVTPSYGLPLSEGDRLWVALDRASGRLVPVRQHEAALVRLTSNVPDADGFLPAVVRLWDSVSQAWSDGNPCWVLDPNAGQPGVGASDSGLELVAGADGARTRFALAHTPVGTLELFVDGLLRDQGVHFTLAGNVVTFATPPEAGAIIQARYNY